MTHLRRQIWSPGKLDIFYGFFATALPEQEGGWTVAHHLVE